MILLISWSQIECANVLLRYVLLLGNILQYPPLLARSFNDKKTEVLISAIDVYQNKVKTYISLLHLWFLLNLTLIVIYFSAVIRAGITLKKYNGNSSFRHLYITNTLLLGTVHLAQKLQNCSTISTCIIRTPP